MQNPTEKGLRTILAVVVALHFLIGGWHSFAHLQIPVPLSGAQIAFIAAVIVLAPVIGAALMWSRWPREAALLIALSMAASLVFGFANHFVLISPDNVMCLPKSPWQPTFVVSAVAIAVSETLGMTLGCLAVLTWRRT
jgi:hypothetical protein